LMAEADAEQRQASRDEFADRLDRVVARLRITRAVRKEHAIRRHREHFARGCLRRYHGDLATTIDQHAQDIELDAVVICDHAETWLGRAQRVVCEIPAAILP